ncbi:TRAP transporter substrate-binding protein [Pikeienuella piscinae]|uniref:TRAP transporter substrate-binding protein n=1 Tax=Pikeienuella piscinae TaxID=2748098 RepID=UPI001FEA943F|nr:TRAP transporter substrate-binding protein DctP [Pikeienuella piscinae]
MKGKKIRVVSFKATGVMEDMGAAAMRIPSSELYLGLQRGTVDAAVCNISTVIGRSLHEQLKYVYKLPVTAFGFGVFVTTKAWGSWPDDVKAAMADAAKWFDEIGASYANDKIYHDEFWPTVHEAGVEVIEASDEDLAALDAADDKVVEEWISQVGEETGRKAIALALGETA